MSVNIIVSRAGHDFHTSLLKGDKTTLEDACRRYKTDDTLRAAAMYRLEFQMIAAYAAGHAAQSQQTAQLDDLATLGPVAFLSVWSAAAAAAADTADLRTMFARFVNGLNQRINVKSKSFSPAIAQAMQGESFKWAKKAGLPELSAVKSDGRGRKAKYTAAQFMATLCETLAVDAPASEVEALAIIADLPDAEAFAAARAARIEASEREAIKQAEQAAGEANAELNARAAAMAETMVAKAVADALAAQAASLKPATAKRSRAAA